MISRVTDNDVLMHTEVRTSTSTVVLTLSNTFVCVVCDVMTGSDSESQPRKTVLQTHGGATLHEESRYA